MTMNVQLTVLIGVLCCFAAEALECKTCMQYHGGTTEHEAIRRRLEAIEQAGDVNCENNAGNDSVPSVVCPEEDIEMMKPVCSTAAIRAKYTIPDTDMSYNMDMTMRGCNMVLTSVEPSCDPIEKYKDELMQPMGAFAGNIADLSGAMCFCEGDNCNTNEAKAGEGDYPDSDSANPFTGEGDYPDSDSANSSTGEGDYPDSDSANPFTGEEDYPDSDSANPSTGEGDYPDSDSANPFTGEGDYPDSDSANPFTGEGDYPDSDSANPSTGEGDYPDSDSANPFTGEGDYPNGGSADPFTGEGNYLDSGNGNGTGCSVHNLYLVLTVLMLFMLMQ